MVIKNAGFYLVAALVVASGAGCKKSEPAQGASSTPPVLAADTAARIHWLGKTRLSGDPGAVYLMRIWSLPQSLNLEAQTLDKLSLAPWRWLRGAAAVTSAPIPLLRPLLDDLVREESYLEVRGATNQPGELAFAIRLEADRAEFWKNNLTAVLESLTGVRYTVSPDGQRAWSLKNQEGPNFIELARVGEWMVLGASREKNTLLGEIVARIQRSHVPFTAPATDDWLKADLDLRRVARALSLAWNLPDDLPKISLVVAGDGENVRARGELNFPEPLPAEMEPWNLPTNLIQEPLIGFTAIRGIQPWLASLKIWNDLQPGTPPNQAYFWAQEGSPFQTYVAAPLPDATNRVSALIGRLTVDLNPWLVANSVGSVQPSQEFNGAVWTGMPFMSPFLRSEDTGEGSLVFGGFMPMPIASTNSAPPAELLQELFGRTNLVCYSWEITQPRINAWLYIIQSLRLVLNKPQLPLDSASMNWFTAVGPRLGNCVTAVTRTSPNQLTLVRNSTVGFTAIELQWLADWLESPQFPRGLHTFLAPPDAPPVGQPPPTAP